MQHEHQQMLGCSFCAFCAKARSAFAAFLAAAITLMSAFLFSALLFSNTAFAQVGVNEAKSAASAQITQTGQVNENETAGHNASSPSAKAEDQAKNTAAALSENAKSTSKNSKNAASVNASGSASDAAATTVNNTGNSVASSNSPAATNNAAASKTFSLTYRVDGTSATTKGMSGAIKLETLESKTVDGITFTFLGWETADGLILEGGSEFTITEDTTLTAVWKAVPTSVDTFLTTDNNDVNDSTIHGTPTDKEDNLPHFVDPTNTNNPSSTNNLNAVNPYDPTDFASEVTSGSVAADLAGSSEDLMNNSTTTKANPPTQGSQNDNSTSENSEDDTESEDNGEGDDADTDSDTNTSTSDVEDGEEDGTLPDSDPETPGSSTVEPEEPSTPAEPTDTNTKPSEPSTPNTSTNTNTVNNGGSTSQNGALTTQTNQNAQSKKPVKAPAKTNLSTQAYGDKNYFTPGDATVYWQWDSTSGTLRIGNDANTTTPTELPALTAATLPWRTATTGGATPQEIKHIVFALNSAGGKIISSSFEGWFEDYTALLSFDGTGLDVSRTTVFARMFKGCYNLTSITGMADWNAIEGRDYAEMFSGCSSLESLNISGLYTADEGTTVRDRTNMLAGMTQLKSIRLGAHTSLVDTGLDTIASKVDRLGMWEAQSRASIESANWKGYGSQLVARYPQTGGVASAGNPITVSITYVFHPLGTFDTNNNVHWDFNTDTNIITIYADPTAAAGGTTVSDVIMPWLSTINRTDVKSVVFATKDLNDVPTLKVAFATLASLFSGYTALTTFDGRGLDTSATEDFSNMFFGCTSLNTIDLTGWQMRNQAQAGRLNVASMLGGCTALKTLKISDGVVLFVSGANDAGLGSLYGRDENNGVWERTDSTKTDPWFGTSNNLANRYNSTGTGFDHGDATYVFTTSYRGGRFDNDNTWWKYTTSGKVNTLTIGADALEPGETGNFQIDWNVLIRGDLPWNKIIGGQPIVNKADITNIVTVGLAAPLNMAKWFEGYTGLKDFNGSGLDTQYCTNFTEIFKGCTAVTNIDISSWDTSAAAQADRANMFDGCTAIQTLVLGRNVDLRGSGLETLGNHSADDGTWVRQNSTTDSWMGSSVNLIDRYSGTGSEGAGLAGAATYFFDTTLLRNTFKSNINVWWQYTKEDKILLIGVNNTGQSNVVTETYDLLPWLSVLGKGTADPAATARAMIIRVDFRNLVTVLNPARWFENYTLMEDAYVGNMDVSQASSLYGVFHGTVKLRTIDGLGNWDTSNITNMSYLFDHSAFTYLGGP